MKKQPKQIKIYTWDDVSKRMSRLLKAVEFMSREDLKGHRDSTSKDITQKDLQEMMELNLSLAYLEARGENRLSI
jgi:hypothetical protein